MALGAQCGQYVSQFGAMGQKLYHMLNTAIFEGEARVHLKVRVFLKDLTKKLAARRKTI